MPEIAEVRLIADNISHFLNNNRIKWIELRDPSISENWAKRGAKGLDEIQKEFPLLVLDVKTKGKFCWIELEKDWKIMIQFGMSGNIRKEPTSEYLQIFNQYQRKEVTPEEYLKHCLLKITYNEDDIIYYHDIRRFGTWVFTKDTNIFNKKLNKLGHDPLQEIALENDDLINRFRKFNHKHICQVLLNQEGPLAGVGNYIRVETMYTAKIDPFALIKNIPDNDLINLYHQIRNISESAYKSGGASLYTYTGMNGDQSAFKDTLKIYKRTLDPFGNPVIHVSDKKVPGRRSLFWVPNVQVIGNIGNRNIGNENIQKKPH